MYGVSRPGIRLKKPPRPVISINDPPGATSLFTYHAIPLDAPRFCSRAWRFASSAASKPSSFFDGSWGEPSRGKATPFKCAGGWTVRCGCVAVVCGGRTTSIS